MERDDYYTACGVCDGIAAAEALIGSEAGAMFMRGEDSDAKLLRRVARKLKELRRAKQAELHGVPPDQWPR